MKVNAMFVALVILLGELKLSTCCFKMCFGRKTSTANPRTTSNQDSLTDPAMPMTQPKSSVFGPAAPDASDNDSDSEPDDVDPTSPQGSHEESTPVLEPTTHAASTPDQTVNQPDGQADPNRTDLQEKLEKLKGNKEILEQIRDNLIDTHAADNLSEAFAILVINDAIKENAKAQEKLKGLNANSPYAILELINQRIEIAEKAFDKAIEANKSVEAGRRSNQHLDQLIATLQARQADRQQLDRAAEEDRARLKKEREDREAAEVERKAKVARDRKISDLLGKFKDDGEYTEYLSELYNLKQTKVHDSACNAIKLYEAAKNFISGESKVEESKVDDFIKASGDFEAAFYAVKYEAEEAEEKSVELVNKVAELRAVFNLDGTLYNYRQKLGDLKPSNTARGKEVEESIEKAKKLCRDAKDKAHNPRIINKPEKIKEAEDIVNEAISAFNEAIKDAQECAEDEKAEAEKKIEELKAIFTTGDLKDFENILNGIHNSSANKARRLCRKAKETIENLNPDRSTLRSIEKAEQETNNAVEEFRQWKGG